MNNLSPKVVLKKINIQISDKSNKTYKCLPEFADEDITIVEGTIKEDRSKLSGNELGFIYSMNSEERNAHFNKCLEMSLENKITPKNAFALQLIDCLSLLVQEKQDFSKMACTLDAGAKIYSNRVDALHQQVVRLADEVILNQKKMEKQVEEGIEDITDSMIKQKRRERKKNIIVSSESLQRNLKGKDPRNSFIKFEGFPGSITNCVRRDPKDFSYSLENNLPIWKNWDEYTPIRIGGTVPLPNIKILREKEKTADTTETIQNYQHQDETSNYMIEGIGVEYDGKTSELSQDSPVCGASDPDYVKEDASVTEEKIGIVTEEVGVVATAMQRLSVMDSNLNGIKDLTSYRLEAMKILFNEASDYHYLDIKNVHFWAGPEFWKRSKPVDKETKKITKKKKEPIQISYNCSKFIEEEKWSSLFKKKTTLTNKTISNWKNNKLLLPMDLKIEINLFFELFNLSNSDSDETFVESKDQISLSGEEEADVKTVISNNNELTDDIQELSGSSTNPDPLNSSFYKGLPGQSADQDNLDNLNSAFYNVGMDKLSTSAESGGPGKVIGIKVASECQNSFDESTLIPVPKIVNVEPIKYSARPIQVDMKHLKETMMNVIREEIEKDMIEKMETPCSSTSKPLIAETTFSHILNKVKTRLEEHSAKDLSIPIAFLGLLTVATENNLQLEDTGYSDCIIRFAN